MFIYHRNEVPLCIAAQCGNAETGIGGDEMRWIAMQVGEVTAAATRHENFLTNFVRAFEHDNAAATMPCRNSAHQPGGASAEDRHIEIFHSSDAAVFGPTAERLTAKQLANPFPD